MYKSPLCSCIICHEVKSAKGIHSHFIGAHGSEDEKQRFSGKGINRQKETSHNTQKEKALKLRKEYFKNPSRCQCCNAELKYESRNNKFCSRKCSAIITNSQKDYTKIKSGPPKGYKFNGRNISSKTKTNIKIPYTKVFQCVICKKYFIGSRKVCDNPVCRYENIKGRVGGYRENSTRKTTSTYNGYKMHSGAERAFAELLDQYNIKWHKNNTEYFVYEIDGKYHKYYPDFYLQEFDLWVEIKGKYYYRDDVDPVKWASVPNIEIIWSNNIKLPAVCTGFEPV